MSTSTIGCVILLGIFALIIVAARRTGQRRDAFAEALKQLGAVPRADCPVEAELVGTNNSSLDCYDLDLRPGVRGTLLIIRRRGTSVAANGTLVQSSDEFIGIYLSPETPQVTAAWFEQWRARVAGFSFNLTGSESRPETVVRTANGGVLLLWRNLLSRENLRARVAAVAQSLSTTVPVTTPAVPAAPARVAAVAQSLPATSPVAAPTAPAAPVRAPREWQWSAGVEEYTVQFDGHATLIWTMDVSSQDDERGYGQHRENKQPVAEFITAGPFESAPLDILAEMAAYLDDSKPAWLDGLRLQAPAMKGDTEMVRRLIAQGISPDVYVLGVTPFYWALKNCHLDTAEALFKAGVDVNRHFRADEDKTALMVLASIAKDESWTPLAQELIMAGAKLDAQDAFGRMPLHAATSSSIGGALGVIRALIAAGANVNAADKNGYTPLMEESFTQGRPDAAQLLLLAGAQVNARDHRDWTPLLWAVSFGRVEMTRALIAAGADVNAVGQPHNQFEKPRSVLQVAEDYAAAPEGYTPEPRYAAILQLVKEAGAK